MLNLVLLGAMLVFGGLTVATGVASANKKAELKIVAKEAGDLYQSFEKYYERHRQYPAAYEGRSFDVETLDPLASRGYYRGILLAKARGHRADAYDSPDDQGPNREFWLELTFELDPSVRFVIAKSDDAPLSGGRWLEGVYVYRDGELERF